MLPLRTFATFRSVALAALAALVATAACASSTGTGFTADATAANPAHDSGHDSSIPDAVTRHDAGDAGRPEAGPDSAGDAIVLAQPDASDAAPGCTTSAECNTHDPCLAFQCVVQASQELPSGTCQYVPIDGGTCGAVDAGCQGPGCIDASTCGSPVVLTISAWIDGESQLTLQGSSVTWHNLSFVAPGLHPGAGQFPTTSLVSCGINLGWCPSWGPGCPCTATTQCGSGVVSSDTFTQLTPPLPAVAQTIGFAATQCREACSLTQQPTAANGYTAIVDFNDSVMSGPAEYEVTLTYTP